MVAKSSSESEFNGVVRGACGRLVTKTLCEDPGDELGIRPELDATAAKGILEAKGILDRTGFAKVRHIDVNCLGLEEQCDKN